MVKRGLKSSKPEDDGNTEMINENGKRAGEDNAKDTAKRVKTIGLYRQPTVKELNRLQETETLFNSNLFRLQVEEVLQEVKVTEKTEKRFSQWFTDFKNHLDNIPQEDTEYDLSDNTLAKHLKVKLPVSKVLKKTKCVFKFHKFNNVEIVGSYSLGCSINSKLCVDIQITVPAETYTKNDSINYRYHKKRAAYLAFIAAHLKNAYILDTINYSWLNGSETLPVIDIKPAGKVGEKLSVRIHLSCESESYKLHRFSPARNNLRESWLLSIDSENNEDVQPPTPYYNSSVLKELTGSVNKEFLHQTLGKSENLKQAIVLLKIWLRQRGLQVSGHIVSTLVAYLVQIKRVNNIMSSYQIVRNVWIALKTSEWNVKGISLHKGSDSPPIEEFHSHFPVVFLDITGYYNFCWQMHLGTYHALRRESARAVDMLDNVNINSFIPLFMVRVTPLTQFDHLLQFTNLPKLINAVISKSSVEDKVNYGINHLQLVVNTLHKLFVRGLTNRVKLIQEIVEADFSWSVKKTPEKARSEGSEPQLSFGLILDLDNALNVVEKGPSANLPEAEKFRSFWGDKSELRRFQDGAITETCVWAGDSPGERRALTKQILEYLLKLKYDVEPSDYHHVCDQLEGILCRRKYKGECEELTADVLRTFDGLRKDLRGLTELPLEISALYGTSPVFSYCEPLPPVRCGAAGKPWRRANACLLKPNPRQLEYIPVCKAQMELGHSGKWPGDLQAFRCLKAAFYLQISQRLSTQYSLPCQTYPTHIDVLKNGIVFRLEISHPKEVTLVRREIENGVVKLRETEESLRLQCETVLMPRLRGALHGLQGRHGAFGPTSCLLQRWLSSQLLGPPHIPRTAVALLAAAAFLRPEPLDPPALPTLALARVLRLLVDTDWSSEHVVLDFNGDMKREDLLQIESRLKEDDARRPALPIVTAHDGDSPGVWCSAVSARVLARARSLAAGALRHLERALTGYGDAMSIFVPSLAGYDALIHLNRSLVPHHEERLDTAALQLDIDTVDIDYIPVVDFDPVAKYLDELRSCYGELAIFFHDQYGGDVIAVLWTPGAHDHKELQVANANALKPVKKGGETVYRVNTAAILEDFRILGEGLVTDITVL